MPYYNNKFPHFHRKIILWKNSENRLFFLFLLLPPYLSKAERLMFDIQSRFSDTSAQVP